jgi:hypothetical protein
MLGTGVRIPAHYRNSIELELEILGDVNRAKAWPRETGM